MRPRVDAGGGLLAGVDPGVCVHGGQPPLGHAVSPEVRDWRAAHRRARVVVVVRCRDAPSVGGVPDCSLGLTPCAATAVPYVSRLSFLSPRPACSEALDLGPEEIRKFLKV